MFWKISLLEDSYVINNQLSLTISYNHQIIGIHSRSMATMNSRISLKHQTTGILGEIRTQSIIGYLIQIPIQMIEWFYLKSLMRGNFPFFLRIQHFSGLSSKTFVLIDTCKGILKKFETGKVLWVSVGLTTPLNRTLG